MTDDELIALEHENLMAYLTGVVSCTSRATVTRADVVVTILTGLPFDWFNQVLVEHEKATPDGVLAGVARAREQGEPVVVRLREGIDDRFVGPWPGRGWSPRGRRGPGMVAFPIDHDPIARHAAPEYVHSGQAGRRRRVDHVAVADHMPDNRCRHRIGRAPSSRIEW